MKRIGPHVSAAGGVQNAPFNANSVGAKAFALFTKNQRQWVSKPLKEPEISAFRKNCLDLGYDPRHILPHDSYLINAGHPDRTAREKSYTALLDETIRCEQLGLIFLNMHPGSHLGGCSEIQCIKYIAECINRIHEKTAGVTLVLENTAGQGANIGYRFEHLAEIISHVADKSRIGVTFDSCHAFAAGYDIRTPETYAQTMQALDTIIGLNYLRGMHLNDARRELGSRIDRHEQIGKGIIGLSGFANFMNDTRLDEIPLIIETADETLWPEEITMLYGMIKKRGKR